VSTFYDLNMRSITGEDLSFADYRGKTCLIVNVASL
jgi:glutathione peroxidase-family protein